MSYRLLHNIDAEENMGSLKENLKGLREDHKLGEVLDEGHGVGSSDGSTDAGRTQTSVSPAAPNAGEYETGSHMEANNDKQGDKNPIFKEISHSVCNNVDQSDSIEVKTFPYTGPVPLKQQPEADKTAVTNEDKAISTELPGDADADNQEEDLKRKNAELENISIPVPFTPGPYDPRSPAPEGQHHMRTQVSLEVVQCHSAATSPMTPPEGGYSFFFPASLERFSGSDTKDADRQVGHRVEFCSVATSPMTPKTPFSCAFPEVVGREAVHKREGVEISEQRRKRGQQETEINASKELSEDGSNERPESSDSAAGPTDKQESLKDKNGPLKETRLGSMDQDITITVTRYNIEEEAEEEELLELHVIKLQERKQQEGVMDVKDVDGMGRIPHAPDMSNTNHTGEVSASEAAADAKAEHSENSHQDPTDASVTRPSVPESPAPFGCHNIRTQVSLEVVQCQSVATSPMTPPEGDQAFCFPSSFGKCGVVGMETKDAELQVGRQVEFRSVATAPMTPRTPTAATFPDIKEEDSIGKIEVEIKAKQEVLEVGKEKGSEVKLAEDDSKEVRNCKEKCEEPVQEVSWDEKGMTWEVYGAVVEVAVLGSAIQKHLEKQVMKKRQPSMPPPPPLNPSAKPLSLESIQGPTGKDRAGKRRQRDRGEVSQRRRNPFRQMMENMQQPHCCAKAHTTE
ncbi:G protein-regulated inducer of neurite outgrowth 3 isoform X1 [Takifugu rubripes]|uniref:G protein-regulated inducer of neurite outgrowth C-terminal domain-containing protein n=2 Tax=Takifugu rubripes TaxID=31033 RepID=A0A3B5K8B6_TAKRU|nr:G protein-regulated inducer of neurite outgrowth 1 isoform X1 [Takifugu rubripes]